MSGVRFGLRFLTGLLHRHAHVAGYGLARAVIAAILEPSLKIGDRGRARVVRDGRSLGHGVRVDLHDTGEALEERFDNSLLGPPMQLAHMQHSGDCACTTNVVVVESLGLGHRSSCGKGASWAPQLMYTMVAWTRRVIIGIGYGT